MTGVMVGATIREAMTWRYATVTRVLSETIWATSDTGESLSIPLGVIYADPRRYGWSLVRP